MDQSSASYTSGNLPSQPTPFIGRKRELDAACALLRREDVRLVTFTGPGGTGKTRLGIQLASELLGDFPDGTFFIALAPISDPALVASTVAQALGLLEAKGTALVESIKNRLRDKKLLIILDNFEQVIDAATLVTWIMLGAPGVKVLVTSREKLHIRGEHEFPVPAMPVPDAQHLPPLDTLTQYESVRLFIDRATATQGDFEVNNENAPAVVEICARLDGLPLAIELAAARIKMLSPQSMLARLQSRLKLLTGGVRDLPIRQQTLRNTIDWSHDLLADDERILFRRLSVFSGGRTLEAIEVICADKLGSNDGLGSERESIDVVESLVDKSLLRREKDYEGEPRFYMLETIQEYSWERLVESGESNTYQEKHAEYFLALAERAEPELRGPEQVRWIRRLEADHDNMRAALKWSLEHERADLALRLGAALLPFWKTRGHLTEGRTWLDIALTRGSESTISERARALMSAGTLAALQDDFTQARTLLEKSLALFREVGDQKSVLDVLRNLGNELRQQGEYETSQEVLGEGLALARELEERWFTACFLGDLGIVKQVLEDNAGARAMYRESLTTFRELRDKRGIARMLVNVGEIARSEEDYSAAQPLYEEALDLARELGDKWGVGMVLHNLGHVAHHQGNYLYAIDVFTESLSLFYEMGYKRDVKYCLAALAGLTGAIGLPERAAKLFAASHTMAEGTTTHLDPADRIEYARNLAAAQAQVSENTWKRAWAIGQLMSLDEAVDYALVGKGEMQASVLSPQGLTTAPLTTHDDATNGYPNGLTEREVDVLRLTSIGLSDVEVAKRLSLSARTVQRHLSSIYSKLDVNSRTAAARFAVEHGLV